MFHHHLNRTGYSSSTAPETNVVLWSNTIGYAEESSPTIADGRVYISSHNQLYCLDITTGSLIWVSTGSGLSSTVFNGKVYVGSENGEVYCLNASTGNTIWSYTANGYVRSSPAVAYGKVYVGSHDSKVYCLDASTGALVWDYTTKGPISCSSPSVVDGMVYIGSSDYKVYCLDAFNGAQIWNFSTSNYVISSPAIANGRVYVGSWDGNIYCLNMNNGNLIWRYNTSSYIWSSPAIDHSMVFIGSYDDKVYCLDASTGRLIWSYKTGDRVQSSPAVADGKVYVGSWDNKVYCLNASTGSEIWNYTTGDRVRSSPAVAGGRVYIGGDKLYCFGSSLLTLNIAPRFNDVLGLPISLPSLWSVEFPNGTVKTVSTPSISTQTQAGRHTIVSIIWGEVEVLPKNAPSIILGTSYSWTPNINCLLPTQISISLSSFTFCVGFNVRIRGKVTCNEMGVSGVPILLSYSVTNGKSWNDIALVSTDSNGNYIADWTPSATGDYLVKAIWSGNETYPSSNIIINLTVTPFEESLFGKALIYGVPVTAILFLTIRLILKKKHVSTV